MTAAIFAILVFLTAMSGALFQPGAWYASLQKPSWTPPNWAFPVVWTILYIFIAIAGYQVWTKVGWSTAMAFWAVQLVLNGVWSYFFFGIQRMDLALIDVGLLWVAILGFIVFAWPVSTLASLLFVPYLLWVSLATVLNLTVLRLNVPT